MYAEERQHAIARLVRQQGRVSVVELASSFEVTAETVRRDLSRLELQRLVRRVHGGAVPPRAAAGWEPALGERDAERAEEKERIARAALDLLPAGEGSVLLDAGSTTARLAALLPGTHRLTVLTHAVPIALGLASHAQVDLHLLPGRVRQRTQAAVGQPCVEMLDRVRVDVAFLGTNGLSAAHGCSTPDWEEAATKQALVRSARRVVVLADATKLGRESAVRFAELADVDVVVTDAEADPAQRRALEAAGLEVVVA